MGHLHLATKDVEASRRFWAALGGVAVQNGALQLIQLPGTFVMLRQSQQTTAGTEGSTVDRVMLRVRAGAYQPGVPPDRGRHRVMSWLGASAGRVTGAPHA